MLRVLFPNPFFLVLAVGLLWVPSNVHAQFDLSRFLSPGPLATPHASLNGATNCTKCHTSGSGIPDQKCLDCHKEIAQKLAKKAGFHAQVEGKCTTCHSDHKGEKYDLAGLSRLPFDHADTGWPLTGSHATVECKSCHKAKRTNSSSTNYLQSNPACLSCHADPHNAQKKVFQKCESCHTTVDWNNTLRRKRFSHTKQTKYPLEGAHRRVKCYTCHDQKVWAPLKFAQCQDCHADPHKGKFGTNCTKCHNLIGWKSFGKQSLESGSTPARVSGGFDHNKTAFPLTGLHNNVKCEACHGSTLGKLPKVNFKTCEGCHKNVHGKQFEVLWTPKKACTSCHTTKGWATLDFDHNENARYELVGNHLKVDCNKCHEKKGRAPRQYRWLQGNPDCKSCHADPHKGQFTNPCATCHTPEGFTKLSFDHMKDSRFPLVGKHQRVQCTSCHANQRYKPIDTRCQTCHNDFHNGALGTECRRCHAPIAFNDIEFNHNREARFKLGGQHLKVPCNKCHTGFTYKFDSMACSSCHVDVHEGGFGDKCERCHTTAGFTATTGFHDFGEFSLAGAHDRVPCETCHGAKATVRTEPLNCTSCHADPHMNTFGTSCYHCHGQNRWLPSTFRHNQTGFELSGAHRFLSCDKCHFNRVFGGLPQECNFCHLKDFNGALPAHVGAPTTCDTCHFTFGWRPSR